MYPKKCFKRYVVLSGLFSAFMALGISIISFRMLLYHALIRTIFVLQPDTYTFQMWEKNPVPLSLKVFLFNWTNTDSINSTIKPAFREIGPYMFDETKDKVNITWDNENGTVSFYHLKRWWFNQEKSNGRLSDNVTSVNAIALASALTARSWSFITRGALNVIHSTVGASAFATHQVGEVLFGGHQDHMLSIANAVPFTGIKLPKFDKFGWFYTRNNSETYEGKFTMDTGVKGQFGQLRKWKDMEKTPYYRGECGKVSGSAGEFFPNSLTKETVIKFYSPDMCRYIELEFEKEVVISGILGYKYAAGDRFLDNGTKIEENKCFCEGNCMPYGALNISVCRYGSPAYVSLPHFNKADPHYRRLIDGMKPDNDIHDFFMIFEPRTGMPLRVAARLQVNLLMQSVPGIRTFRNVPEAYMPVLWFEQVVDVPGQFIFFIKLLNNFENICLAIGMIFIFGPIVCKILVCYKLCNSNIFGAEKAKTPIKEEIPLTFTCT